MKVYLEPDELDVRIEIVPLIDVIFCILVFFILGAVSFARMEGLNVDLPQASSAQTQFGDTLPVEVDALGQIKIQNTTVTEDQLSQLLAAYVAQKPDGVVVLQADKLVSYGQVARLIDLLQKVGGTRVALGATAQSPVPNSSGTEIPGTGLPLDPNLGVPNLGVPNNPVMPVTPDPNTTVPNSGTAPAPAPADPQLPNNSGGTPSVPAQP